MQKIAKRACFRRFYAHGDRADPRTGMAFRPRVDGIEPRRHRISQVGQIGTFGERAPETTIFPRRSTSELQPYWTLLIRLDAFPGQPPPGKFPPSRRRWSRTHDVRDLPGGVDGLLSARKYPKRMHCGRQQSSATHWVAMSMNGNRPAQWPASIKRMR